MVKPSVHWHISAARPDHLGADFYQRDCWFQGPRSPVVCTLIDYTPPYACQKTQAVLYLHGYTDYFFQADLAKMIDLWGWRFCAIDLQGYGRSIRPSTPPNACEALTQYFTDIDVALATLFQDGIQDVSLLAHSTGALIASRYLQSRQSLSSIGGAPKPRIRSLIVNSPFFALPFPPQTLPYMNAILRRLTGIFPFVRTHSYQDKLYAKTLHVRFGGEWDYRLDWKPSMGFLMSWHWLHDVINHQHLLQTDPPIPLPTLLCRSNCSTYNTKTVQAMRQGDGVLDVESMQQVANRAFANLETAIIPSGFHDLFLSPAHVRQKYLDALHQWLQKHHLMN